MTGVRLGSNIDTLKAHRGLTRASSTLSSAIERLASGQRINRASDDAAGLSISSALNLKSRVFAQASRNVNDSLSLAAVSAGALQQLSAITMRQMELAEQSANGPYGTKQRAALDAEARALTNEYNRIIETTKFNGMSLFTSPWEQLQIQAGIGADAILSARFADDLSTKATPGSYFTIDGVGSKYYVWFTVDGVGSDPRAGDTGRRVDLWSTNTLEGAPATAASVEVITGDGSQYSSGEMFYAFTPSAAYYFWFNVDGTGSDPGDLDGMGATGFEISINSGDTDQVVASQVLAAMSGSGAFTGSVNANTVSVTNTELGLVGNGAYSYNLSAGSVNQNTSGSDSTTTGHAKVQTATEVRDAVIASLAATGQFSSQIQSDGSVIITNVTTGRVVDVNAGTSGIVITDPLSNGTGRSYYSMGSFDSDMRLGDFNGDGEIDVVTTNAFTSNFSVRLGQGDGSFGTQSVYLNGGVGQVYNMYTADINRDGKLDLIGLGTSTNATVLLGNGDGSFRAATQVALGVSGQHAIRAADMNGDGNLDLIATTTAGATIRLGNGDNTWRAASSYAMGTNPYHGMEVGDVNNDGKIDVVIANASANSFSIALGNGDGSLRAATSYSVGGGPAWVALGDVNGDGRLDVAVSNSSTNDISVRLGAGDGTFGGVTNYASGSGPRNVVLTDMNGDGLADLLYTSPLSNYVSVRFATGGGSFGSATNYSMGSGTSGVGLGDLNNDGINDLVTSDYNSNTVSTRRGVSGGVFEATNTAGRMRLVFGDTRGMTQINHVDLTTMKKARSALTTLSARLDRINSQVGAYGSMQSRLQAAAGTLLTTRENYLAAEGRIKNADVAQESALYVRGRILQEAAASVLLQANVGPELSLTLLGR